MQEKFILQSKSCGIINIVLESKKFAKKSKAFGRLIPRFHASDCSKDLQIETFIYFKTL